MSFLFVIYLLPNLTVVSFEKSNKFVVGDVRKKKLMQESVSRRIIMSTHPTFLIVE